MVSNISASKSTLSRWTDWIPGVKTIKTWNSAKKAISYLDLQESTGTVKLHSDRLFLDLKTLSSLSSSLKKSRFIHKKVRHRLERRLLALSARQDVRVISTDPKEANKQLSFASKLQEAGRKYKNETYSITDKNWTESDQAVIDTLMNEYPKFANLLIKNTKLRNQFFEWSILHRFPSQLFVKYATITQVIPKLALQHIASACPSCLQEETDQTGSTRLTINCKVMDSDGRGPIFKKYNVLNPTTKVSFTAENKPTIKQILTQFPSSSSAERDYQFFEDGLHYWQTGAFPHVDFSQPHWWEQLPLYKTLNLEEAKARYQNVDGKNWILSPRCVHLSDDFVLANNHAYLEVAIPVETSDGTVYRIYPFGKNPAKDPFGLLKTLIFLEKTTYGRITYADQGAYYTERRNTGMTISMTPAKGENLMKMIGRDIQLGMNDKQPFQLCWRNCAEWVQSVVDRVMPRESSLNLFEVDLKQIKGPLGSPKPIRKLLMTAFGAHRKREINGEVLSISKTPFYQRAKMNHPVNLVKIARERSEMVPIHIA
jgi:hypothetical protein